VLNPTVPEWARLTLPVLRRPAPAALATAVTGVAFGLLEGVRVGLVTAAALAGFLLLDRLLAGRAGGPVLAPRAAAVLAGFTALGLARGEPLLTAGLHGLQVTAGLLAAALALGLGGALERRRQPERAGSGRLAEIHASRSPHQR
jgi:hypothetical protein